MNAAKLHIVYATDNGYLLPTVVAACSAAFWTSENERVVIDILDCGLDEESWTILCKKVKQIKDILIVRHPIDMSRFNNYREWNNSRGIYARLLLPDILNDVDWCVYCDGDTLFTDDPLKLEKYCDGRYALVGHKDNDNTVQAEWFPTHGIEWNRSQYVCAGFVVINLRWMREHDGVKRLFDFISEMRPPFNDQDALYFVCKGFVNQLENGWGVFGYLSTIESMRGCVHYASDQPWRLRYTPHRGMLDIKRFWFVCARQLAGYSVADCVGKSGVVKYCWMLFVSKWFRLVFCCLARVPGLKFKTYAYFRQTFPKSVLKSLVMPGVQR